MRGEEENSGGGIGAYLAVGDVAEVSERIAEGALVRLERQVADHDAVTRHGGRTFHVRASCVSTFLDDWMIQVVRLEQLKKETQSHQRRVDISRTFRHCSPARLYRRIR